jgi:hypothetical protein
MHSSLIGKIEKARRYAQERDRVNFTSFKTTFRGANDQHVVEYSDGRWRCTCDFFGGWGLCAHTMALERILGEMLPKEARDAANYPAQPPAQISG